MAGPWEKYRSQGVPIGLQDPARGYEAPQAAANINKTNADIVNAAERLRIDRERLAFDRAEAARKEREEAELRKRMAGAQSSAEQELRTTIGRLDALRRDSRDSMFTPGLGETGHIGSWLRDVPGTAAYGMREDVKTVQANTAFDRLQRMRDMSPTGGALGQITEKELDLLKATVGSIDPNQKQEDFEKNIASARAEYIKMLRRMNPRAAAELEQGWDEENGLYGTVTDEGKPKPRKPGLRGAPRKNDGWKVERID